MNRYILKNLNDNKYNRYLLCLTYDSILNYIDLLENDNVIKNSKGVLLIDQLLVCGNGKNRYITCEYNNGNILLTSAQNITPEKYYLEMGTNLLGKHLDLLRNSILTEKQIGMIEQGVTF